MRIHRRLLSRRISRVWIWSNAISILRPVFVPLYFSSALFSLSLSLSFSFYFFFLQNRPLKTMLDCIGIISFYGDTLPSIFVYIPKDPESRSRDLGAFWRNGGDLERYHGICRARWWSHRLWTRVRSVSSEGLEYQMAGVTDLFR